MRKFTTYLLLFATLLSNVSFAGRLQDADFKTLTEVGGPGNEAKLLNDTKVYVTSLSKRLSNAIVDGDIGGGGAATGSNVNLLVSGDNRGFEAGAVTWVASGGAFATTGTNPFFGALSGTFDASALNQTLSTGLKAIPEGLKGQLCTALMGYEFTGTNADYVLEVFDGTSVVAGATANLVAGTGKKEAQIDFTCPSSGSILLRVRANVADPALIKLDGGAASGGVAFLGSQIFSLSSERIERATIANTGTASILRQSGSWISSVSRTGAGRVSVNLVSSLFSSTPSCTVTVASESAGPTNRGIQILQQSTTLVEVATQIATTNTDIDSPFNIVCMGAK
jgi:hypothetical protein